MASREQDGCFLHAGFLRSAARHPDRPALSLRGQHWTYAELDELARRLAAELIGSLGRPPGRVGLLTNKSLVSYVGMLAILYGGGAVVPLNRTFPVSRIRVMAMTADVDVIVTDTDADSAGQPEELTTADWQPRVVVLSEAASAPRLRTPHTPAEEDLAYLLFTSGTTGTPKGVPISHGNIAHFLHNNTGRYDFGVDDRFTQIFSQTFDLAICDIFSAWQSGGCVVPLDAIHQLAPFRFVREQGITVWCSVPSTVTLLRHKGLLTPGSLPTLRWSLFCGEVLTEENADAWQLAAPNSTVENLYGPTEVTITSLAHRWDPAGSPRSGGEGGVPIGTPHPGVLTMIVDAYGRPVGPGEDGQLCLAGPQVFSGYWRAPELTAAALFTAPDGTGVSRTWYRTGDLVRRLPDGEHVFLGRTDHQVKVHGMRVELGDVEAHLKALPGVGQSAVVALPGEIDGGVRLVAFVVGPDLDAASATGLVDALRGRVPNYMVPQRLHVLPEVPLNHNGKTDRAALMELAAHPSDRKVTP